ncbi:hypothetical protein HDU84_009721, partial [Entophlyctis sp. JEL0112]
MRKKMATPSQAPGRAEYRSLSPGTSSKKARIKKWQDKFLNLSQALGAPEKYKILSHSQKNDELSQIIKKEATISPKKSAAADDEMMQSGKLSLTLARDLLYDVSRLAARFHPALDFNPLHIYQSALTFTPHDTKLYQLYQFVARGKVTASPDLTWGPLVSSLSGHTDAVTSVAYNHDGSLIASGSADNTVRVWNPLTGDLVSELQGHSWPVNSVAFNHDGSLIASGSWDKT